MLFVSMVLMFIMSALGKQFKEGGKFISLNWIAQIVNTLVQALMALPAIKMFKLFGKKEIKNI